MTEHKNTYGKITLTALDALRAGQLKIHGRYEVLEGGAISCDFTACGISFRADCAGEVRVTVSVRKPFVDLTAYATDHGYFTVWVNGVRRDSAVRGGGTAAVKLCGVRAAGTEQSLLLAAGLPAGEHEFTLLKQSDPHMNVARIHSLTLCGTLLDPPAPKPRLIEFIGDSLTAGFGNLGLPDTGSFDADYQDGTQTYAFFAAEALGADARIIARAGIGLRYCSTYTQKPMSEVWHLRSYWRSEETEYVSARVPDLVVVNLFANDRTKIKSEKFPDATCEGYAAAMRHFLGELRKFYPGVPILVLDHPGAYEPLSRTAAGVAAEFDGVTVRPYERFRTGYSNHPNTASNRTQAEVLVGQIRELYPELFGAEIF